MTSPGSNEVVDYRQRIQKRCGLGITAAQDRCAAVLHSTRRAWQHWERGERSMHPALWELAQIKQKRIR